MVMEVYDTQLTPAASLQARTLLGWSRRALAAKSEVCERTIVGFERGQHETHFRTLQALWRAFRKAGVEFAVTERGDQFAYLREKSN